MTKLRLLFALAGTIALSMAAAAGVGAVGGPYVCSGGTPDNPTAIPAGTYPDGIVVTGNCLMTGDSTEVDGDLVVAPGAILNDHAASSTVVHVTGNAYVERHGVLGLGDYSPGNGTTVDGNVVARAPLSLYLGGMTVHGSLVSIGGGLGPGDFFRNLPLKDDVIDGNVVVVGWHGGWMGLIRLQVGGSVLVAGNRSSSTEEGPGVDPDSTEVMTNVIQGNLVCFGNTPHAQVNLLDGGQPNYVGGIALGECAGLTGPMPVSG